MFQAGGKGNGALVVDQVAIESKKKKDCRRKKKEMELRQRRLAVAKIDNGLHGCSSKP